MKVLKILIKDLAVFEIRKTWTDNIDYESIFTPNGLATYLTLK